MRKREVVRKVVAATGIETTDVETVIDALFTTIKKEVGGGIRIDFREFGSFQPVKRKAKAGRDIGRNLPIHVPERSVPVFKPSERFFKIIEK
jgi:nucleoid DNA-binding protein